MPVSFTVYGIAVPQGSMRGYVVNGRALVVSDNKKPLKSWRSDVKDAAWAACGKASIPYSSGPVSVLIRFVLPIPKSKQRKRTAWPKYVCSKPDLDKLARAALDAMTGAVFTDDAQVAVLSVSKQYTLTRDEAPASYFTINSL